MKKILILLLCLFATDSFATGISGGTSAPCDNDTLNKYNGTANIEINWEPNVIGLKWYDGETELNVANASQTCTYDNMITVPPQPTKPGYTFNGWKIPKYDFSTLPTNTTGTHRYGKGIDASTGEYRCMQGTGGANSSVLDCSDSNLADLNGHEWKVLFTWGTIYGTSICSSTSGESFTIGTPDESSKGRQCWCKVIGYVPSGSSIKYLPAEPAVYVITSRDYFSDTTCPGNCPTNCAYYLDNKKSPFVSNLFSH